MPTIHFSSLKIDINTRISRVGVTNFINFTESLNYTIKEKTICNS